MTTITAVDLRRDLDSIIKRASKGESIRVSYRGSNMVTIGPDTSRPLNNTAAVLAKAAAISSRVPQDIKDKYKTDSSIENLIQDIRMSKYA
jgi:antitoxin (DNA-binding transcriptional repressor) of toxin-antitoxin stability system